MKILNKSKKLIVLNYKEKGKGFKTLLLGAGETVENEFLVDGDVAFYVKKGSIEVLEKTKTKTPPKPIVLPEVVNEESLKAMATKDLRKYCKENDIKIPANTDEDGVIALVLESLEPKE